MAASLHAARLVAYEAACRYDHAPETRQLGGALSKLIGAEVAFRIADDTMQIFGGAGYSKDQPIERIWREVRVAKILDGVPRRFAISSLLKCLAGCPSPG